MNSIGNRMVRAFWIGSGPLKTYSRYFPKKMMGYNEVKVFPEPVCPYANKVPLIPSSASLIIGLNVYSTILKVKERYRPILLKASSWVLSLHSTWSNVKLKNCKKKLSDASAKYALVFPNLKGKNFLKSHVFQEFTHLRFALGFGLDISLLRDFLVKNASHYPSREHQ